MKRFMILTMILFAAPLIFSACDGGGGNDGGSGGEVQTYSVTYYGNDHDGGDVPVDLHPYREGETVQVRGNEGRLARTGFHFAGWNTVSDGSGTTYQAGNEFTMGTENVSLYVKWTKNPAQVIYHANDGTADPHTDPTVYEKGDTVTVAGNTFPYVKEGYTFRFWNTKSGGNGTTYRPGDTFTMGDDDVTLYAQWTDAPLYVTYNNNGGTIGSVPVDNTVYVDRDEVTVKGNTGHLGLEGYTFVGWNRSADGSSNHYYPGDTFEIQQNITLYAEWVKPGTRDKYFNPQSQPLNLIAAIAVQDDGKILIGGAGGEKIARLNSYGIPDENFDPGTGASGGNILSIAIQSDGKILIAGQFTEFNGVARNRIARLNSDGSLDTNFDPGTGADNRINAIVLQGDRILIGGQFSSYCGEARDCIARLYSDGTLDTSFNQGNQYGVSDSGGNPQIYAIAVSGDAVYIGGKFTHCGSNGCSNFAFLYGDGEFASNLGVSVVDKPIHTIAVQDSGRKILFGGEFTNFHGKKYFVRWNKEACSLDTTFNDEMGTGVDKSVYAIALQEGDGKILIGGSFDNFNDSSCNKIARIIP